MDGALNPILFHPPAVGVLPFKLLIHRDKKFMEPLVPLDTKWISTSTSTLLYNAAANCHLVTWAR